MNTRRKTILVISAVLLAVLVLSLLLSVLLSGWAVRWFYARSANQLGLAISMDSCRANLFTTHLVIRGLKLSNSAAGFANPVMLSIPELDVDLEWVRSLWRGQPYFRRLTIDVAELNVERRADGVSNWDRLLAGRDSKGKKAGGGRSAVPVLSLPDIGQDAGAVADTTDRFTIETLQISVGRIRVQDAQSALIGDLDVDAGLRHHEMRDIHNSGQLAGGFLAAILPAIAAQAGDTTPPAPTQESAP